MTRLQLNNVKRQLCKQGVLVPAHPGGPLEFRHKRLCADVLLMHDVCSLLMTLCMPVLADHPPRWLIGTMYPHDQMLLVVLSQVFREYYTEADAAEDARLKLGVALADLSDPPNIDAHFGCDVADREVSRRDVLIVCGAPVGGSHVRSMVGNLGAENVMGVVALVAPQGITAKRLGVPYFKALVRYRMSERYQTQGAAR